MNCSSEKCGACRTPTRERLKLIPRVANVEQWAAAAPLSAAEFRLARSYNGKPLLTRPQHKARPPTWLAALVVEAFGVPCSRRTTTQCAPVHAAQQHSCRHCLLSFLKT